MTRAWRLDRNRSLGLSALAPLLALPGVTFVSLQTNMRPEDADALRRHRNVVDAGAGLQDFADTAAVISLLDLVITVDTPVAHLAGALSKPVWILLPAQVDWRWLLVCQDLARPGSAHRRD